jgi:hypothetical protein
LLLPLFWSIVWKQREFTYYSYFSCRWSSGDNTSGELGQFFLVDMYASLDFFRTCGAYFIDRSALDILPWLIFHGKDRIAGYAGFGTGL